MRVRAIKEVFAVCVVMLFLLSCGGCGSGGVSSEGPPNVSLAPIVASDYIETVPVLVNQSYADVHPDLVTKIAQIIEDANAVLAKDPDNKKQYVLGNVLTYPDAYSSQFDQINNSPEYFTDNHFIGNPNYGGTTIVYWVQPEISMANLPAVFQRVASSAVESEKSVNGKRYGVVFIAEQTSATALLGRNMPSYMVDLSVYDYGSKIKELLHELGHTFGLGVPEWYSLISGSDKSGTLPMLSINYQSLFPQDPMSSVFQSYGEDDKFTPFNSWLITHNANHQLSKGSMIWAAQNLVKTQVKVVDTLGAPVPNATVTVYGGVIKDVQYAYRGASRNMATVLQTHVTDTNGMVSLDRDVEEWYAWGVKASRNEKYTGALITLIDLEDAFFRQGLNTYTLTLTLR